MSSTLYIVAPEGRPWPIGLDAAEASLREHWPTASVKRVVSAVNGKPYLSFDVQLNGIARWGTYAASDVTCLSLSDADPAGWADTIVWFLGLLPAGSTALAAVAENPKMIPLPPTASAQDVREAFERLVSG